ncbi:hypothetical protein CEXT_522951 [Caerostris extrusa]|uniref:Uncharacterized protein n=1 Tax=Caerostris extrusa TaxID=172846 RepID=A0AAV4QM31_CAEEX|nr:hypothetical protein CEXT_522951 [Caerostris extrusa]
MINSLNSKRERRFGGEWRKSILSKIRKSKWDWERQWRLGARIQRKVTNQTGAQLDLLHRVGSLTFPKRPISSPYDKVFIHTGKRAKLGR